MSGSVIFSVEIELGWGYHDLQRPNRYAALSENRGVETEALKRLLALCDRFDIPITFDVVGHLFLSNCSGAHETQYPTGWFDADPGTDVESNPLFYAPDLIEMIEAAEVDHEICTHTFSHALGEKFSPGQLDTDIKQAQRLHRDKFGKSAESIVPPRHQRMDHEVLKQNGIRVIRQTTGEMPESKSALLWWYFSRNHPVLEPVTSGEIVTTYTSVAQSLTAPYVAQGQRPVHQVLRSIPLRVRKYIHQLYIENALARAATESKQAHFWTHLHDMANEAQLDIVEQAIEMASDWRDNKKLDIIRMCDLRTHT
ncbi:polysaccharide deacetylase family protein [Halorubrum ezzemoulense]|uniref:polysaccharide deacetylase family protein n=1 Tax=Halorubrum ezzemoulense TaxID=337243 RepID=UPI00232B651C|nr:polysaccharide deacetylase family protein [Halorubrum ezzemoulense]MDB9253337.1 polysaccharide deacetylase family protein [Halorubrum ezzemoulense]MDB9256298.1 polysaccharide deacetylase family protein [Halorubrum ezzemoulense]MDB9277654.1 polysaccharide deacetylase family protein [Halorubrum ezzemoulense]